MSEPEMAPLEDDHPDVLKPHTRSDLIRVGWVIWACFIPVAGIGVRFFIQQQDPATASRNFAAAVMFWVVAAMLFSVGVGILLKARKAPQG